METPGSRQHRAAALGGLPWQRGVAGCLHAYTMTRTESVTEIPLRFYTQQQPVGHLMPHPLRAAAPPLPPPPTPLERFPPLALALLRAPLRRPLLRQRRVQRRLDAAPP